MNKKPQMDYDYSDIDKVQEQIDKIQLWEAQMSKDFFIVKYLFHIDFLIALILFFYFIFVTNYLILFLNIIAISQ